MNPMIQPGTHPDAEILTAFAEQLVTDREREDILAHMAVCSRCREAVFLAQKATEAEGPTRTVLEVPDRRSGGGWFAGWRWSWVPVAALAGLVGFAVIQHMRHTSVSETRMAQNAAPPDIAPSSSTTRTTATPLPPPPPPSHAESKQELPARERSDRDTGLDRRSSQDLKDVTILAQKRDELKKETDSLEEAPPKVLGGAVHGTMEARAKSSGVGGPMAQNQVQQQNNAQLQQNYANDARQSSALSDSLNKPVSAPVQTGSTSQTVTVQAVGGPIPVSPAPSAAPAIAAQMESVVIADKKPAKLKAGNSALPSKLDVLSETTTAKITIAIDTAGSVFLSEDAGRHWQGIDAPWSGRAVLVKRWRPSLSAAGGLLKQAAPKYELTTDKPETWVSQDGKQWMLEAPPGK